MNMIQEFFRIEEPWYNLESEFIRFHAEALNRLRHYGYRHELWISNPSRMKDSFRAQGTHMAFVNIGALFGYGDPGSPLRLAFAQEVIKSVETRQTLRPPDTDMAQVLAFSIMSSALRQPENADVFSHVHIMLAFIYGLTSQQDAMDQLKCRIPWPLICSFLNQVNIPQGVESRQWTATWPKREKAGVWEEVAMQGQIWCRNFPVN